MALILSSSLKAKLLEWAIQAEPDECCGLLLGRGGLVETALLATNVSQDPRDRFEIDPATLVETERASRNGGMTILGYFHSHPATGRTEPSARDLASAANDGRIWLIIAAGRLQAWMPVAEQGFEAERFEPVPIIEG